MDKISRHIATKELSRLLRKAGFNYATVHAYVGDRQTLSANTPNNHNAYDSMLSAPEHWQIVDWLYNEKGVYVSTRITSGGNFVSKASWIRGGVVVDLVISVGCGSPHTPFECAVSELLETIDMTQNGGTEL